ncbi:MAG: Mrp/NBP35 family ATP-binding protein [Gemmatimonadaceae bacterium]|nr:Mrp/NBP35 family ATP-binding protein [Gemmatimonadaceae bacterium]
MSLTQQITTALGRVRNPRLDTDVMSAEMVQDIATTVDGKVQFTLLLDSRDDATLVRDVRQAVVELQGVTDVKVNVRDPRQQTPTPARPGRALPMAPEAKSAQQQAPRVAAPTPVALPNLGRILAVSSGKGGVGKSTVSVNLAIALAGLDYKRGLMDADIYGPNIPLMMGLDQQPEVNKQAKIIPLEAYGVKLISLGFLIEKDQPAIWRGPIVMKLIGQFLKDVEWGQLDYFIVDMPPGTGDAQLSLVQTTLVTAALIVTTPQQVSTGDALRGVKMFERVAVPVLGIVENMSWFENPETGKPIAMFGSGGGQQLATQVGLELLAQIPIDPRIAEGGDTGRPLVAVEPTAPASKVITALAARVVDGMNAIAARS